jgi:phenylpyruvate tautomerase PptA (4-oxalocrotonate tautomerase family)
MYHSHSLQTGQSLKQLGAQTRQAIVAEVTVTGRERKAELASTLSNFHLQVLQTGQPLEHVAVHICQPIVTQIAEQESVTV